MAFCVDTSAWLDGWRRNYPRDVFQTLWTSIEVFVDAGEIIASEEVYVEIAKKDDDLHEWIQARKTMLVPPEEEIQEREAELLAKIPTPRRYTERTLPSRPLRHCYCNRTWRGCRYRRADG